MKVDLSGNTDFGKGKTADSVSKVTLGGEPVKLVPDGSPIKPEGTGSITATPSDHTDQPKP